MSWEVFGTDDEGTTADDLCRAGWECDPDAEVWWRVGEPDETYTFEEASNIYEETQYDFHELDV